MKKRSARNAGAMAPAMVAAALAAQMTAAQDAAVQSAAPQASPQASSQAASEASPQAGTPAAAGEQVAAGAQASGTRLRFNFKGQTYDQILDYFSRTTGYPIVRETEVPKGTVDYIYPKDYTLDEAIQTLNVLLQTQNCMLRVEGGRMFLQKLDDMKRENVPTFIGTVPSQVTDDTIVTVVMPLLNAQAKPVAEQLKNLVATYGSVTALEQQNSILLVETAAQVRRLQRIIDEIDRKDVENLIEFIPIRHARAADLLKSLQALMGERVVEYVVNPADGKRTKIEENRVAGLVVAADDRTNAIVARGSRAKIDQLKQTIDLLDVPVASGAEPTAAGGRGMKTFSVSKVKAPVAKERLEQLFAAYPADKKPTVVALPEAERVTIVGDLGSIDDAERFIAEMEGFDPSRQPAKPSATVRDRLRGDRAVAALELESASPEAILAAAKSLLSKRQQDEISLVAGPDGRTILVAGDSTDIAGIRAIVETLDRPANVERQVRLMRVASKDAEQSVTRARELYEQQTPAADAARSLRIELDAASRELVLIGSAQSIARFTELLNQVDGMRAVERETRQIVVSNAQPSAIAPQLRELAKQVLDPRDGTEFTAPAIEPLDATRAILVSGTPEQVAEIQSLTASLDRPTRDAFAFRAMPVPGIDAPALVVRADSVYAQLARGGGAELEKPTVEVDASSGALLVSGRRDAVALYETAVAQARLLLPPPRAGKIIPMRAAAASEVAAKLTPLLASASPVEPSRTVPAAEIRVIDATNALYIVGEAPQIALIESFIRDLDVAAPEALPPLRLLQLRGGDAAQVATMLTQRYDTRAPEQRRAQPVRIESDATTNTLVVTAHPAVFEEIRALVDDMNRAGDAGTGPARETFVVALKSARASELSAALDRLYPPPPVPLDARGRPLPHLQKQKEVFVTADATTNSLIVEAPSERRASFEELVATLDRTPLPPQAELRTYRVEKGDIERIATSLRDLAARGMLSKPGVDGAKPVEVLVQPEPVSRTLIVAGDSTTFEKAEQLLKQLQAVPMKRGVRVIDAGATDPVQLVAKAMKLAGLDTASSAAGTTGIAPTTGPAASSSTTSATTTASNGATPAAISANQAGAPVSADGTSGEVPPTTVVSSAAPVIETEIDAANGTIIASGEEEPLTRFADACREILAATSPGADVRVVPLSHVKAADAKASIEGLASSRLGQAAGFAREPAIEILERTNSLLVAADARQQELLAAIVRNIDVPVGATPPMRILQLRTADAATLASALNAQYAQRSPDEKGAKPVQITAEPQTNALIVAAHPDLLPEIQQVVETLNGSSRQSASDREIRIFSLKVARAAELAKTIDEMYPPPPVPVDPRGRARPELQQPREVVVRADAQTNSLIVDAPVARMAGFEELVKQLDRAQAMPDAEIRTWRVSDANVDTLAKTVRDLAQAGQLGPEGTGTIVSVEPISKTLVVSGPPSVFTKVEQVVRGVEGAAQPSTTLRVFKLKVAKAETLAPLVRSALEGRLAQIEPTLADKSGRVLDVAADRRSNALIVSAPDALIPVVEELVRQLDDGSASAGSTEPVVRVRPLSYADATQVSASLSQALAVATNPTTREPLSVKVIPAAGANALLLVGPASDLDEAEKLVTPLDERPALDSVDAKTFTLTNADASRIAPLVQRLLSDQQETDPRIVLERMRRNRGQADSTPPVRVEADTRTNALIVSGAARIMSVAEGLIKELDREGDATSRAWSVFTPSRAAVAGLVDEARRILDATNSSGVSRVELSALPASGTIVIVGTADGAEKARTLLTELDQKAFATPEADFRVVQLKHVAPDVVVAALSAVLTDRSRWPSQLVAAAKAGAPIVEPKFVADVLNARVVITAPTDLMPIASKVIDELDRARDGDRPAEIRVYPLSQASAPDVAKAVEQALAARVATQSNARKPSIAAEPTSNALVVAADPAQLDEVDAIVRTIDVRGPRDAARVRTVFLKNARAAQMAPLVEQLLAGEARRVERTRPSGAVAAVEPALRVIADERLNAVIMSATPGALDAAEEMLQQLDVAPGRETDRVVRVLALRNADAAEIAKSLIDLFETDDGTETPPVIRTNTASNSLLVRATEKQFATIEEIVTKLDGTTVAGARTLRSVPLDPSKGDAEDMARLLRRLMESSDADVEVISVEELLKRYEPDAKPAAGTNAPQNGQSRVFPSEVLPARPFVAPTWPSVLPARMAFVTLAFAQVTPAGNVTPPTAEVAPKNIVPTKGDEERAREAGGVTVAVDRDTNSLVLLGSQREIERALKLVEQASKALPGEGSRVRAIKLPASSDPVALASVVVGAVARMTPAGGVAGDLAKRVAIVPDPETRSLLVVATDRDFESVGQLVATLARSQQTETVVVKSYVLRSSGADRVAEALRAVTTQAGGTRLKALAVTLAGDMAGGSVDELAFDPSKLRVIVEKGANAITVVGSPEAIAFADRFVAYADREERAIAPEMRLLPLKHAKASELARTLTSIFASRGRSLSQQGIVVSTPEFAADERTNTLVVSGGAELAPEVERIVARLDEPGTSGRAPLETIALAFAKPSEVSATIDRLVIGSDNARRERTQVVADDSAGVLLVRADAEVLEEIRGIVREIDRAGARQYLIRQIRLERADAQRVAQAIQKLLDERAQVAGGGRTRGQRAASVIGDPRSSTIFVAANDQDFAEIEELVKGFDAPEVAAGYEFKVFTLRHARAGELARTVEQMLNEVQGASEEDSATVRADEKRNALVVIGRGDRFALVGEIVATLDVALTEGEARSVRMYEAKAGELEQVAALVRDTLGERPQRPWESQSAASGSRVITVPKARQLVIRATDQQHAEVKTLLDSLAKTLVAEDRETAVIPVEFATPAELAQTLRQFLDDRAAGAAGGAASATIVPSASGGALLVAGTKDEVGTVRDLVARLDQPQSGGDRQSDIIVLKKGRAVDIARMVAEQFRGRGGAQNSGQGVAITPDVRTNALLVSAPSGQFEQVRALVERLDAPSSAEETLIRTFALKNAKAEDAVRVLTQSLQLDATGRTQGVAVKVDPSTPAVQVNARVVADRRSNALVVTGTVESFPVIEKLLSQLEESPARATIEYRIVPLKAANASEIALTLERLVGDVKPNSTEEAPRIEADPTENRLLIAATPEQFERIEEVILAIDVPPISKRITEFVALKAAKARGVQEALGYFYGRGALDTDSPAKKSVRIVGDEGTNSLVISAEESEWPAIRELVAKLDNEQYDGSRQLRVVGLRHADARAVATAINEAFKPAPVVPQPAPRGEPVQPIVVQQKLDEQVNASADEFSNNLVVAASPANMRKIEAIIAQLDQPDFSQLPPPRLIEVRYGNPEQLARSIERVYGPGRAAGRDRGLRIVGDAASNALIVRASEEDFAQIAAIAEALQQQATEQGLQVHLLRLKSAPAPRIAAAIREAFAQRARQANLPLSIQIDTVSNGLVVASTGPIFEEIRTLVEQMDALAPDASKGIFIIDLINVAPESAKKIIEEIGLDRPQPADSVSKVISEPLKVSVAAGRSALVIVANPADRDTILSLLKSIDTDPPGADAEVRIVRMKNAAATSIAATLNAMVAQAATPAAAGAKQGDLARALQEQVRRLRIQPDGASAPIALDLQKPVKILADATSNSLVLASTADNVRALEEAARLFDTLPVTDAAVVRVIPLSNIQATQFARVVRELFTQGKQIGVLQGTQVKAQAGGATGEALAQDIAITVDDRTNTVVVAGKEEAVAMVDVLRERLDSQVAVGWIEPRIVKLRYADAGAVAEMLRSILVDGSTKLPESSPLQKQVGRIRMARATAAGEDAAAIESDVFVPFTQLVIRPDATTNSLVLVGSTQNLEIVSELLKSLDTEAAAPGALVRIYPLENASASRIGPLLVQLFDQQFAAKTIRAEDRVRVIPDERLNSIVVSTSARSFAVIEELLKSLDQKVAPDIREIRTIELKNASAPRLAAILQRMMDARVDRLKRANPETADLERTTIAADDRTNQLLVAAGADAFDVVRSLVADLDVAESLEESGVEVVPVGKANIERLAAAIKQILDRRFAELSPEVAKRVKPLVLPDPRTNALLVAGGPEDAALVRQIAARLEEIPSNPAVGVHVLPLAAARAETIAPRIQQLMRDRATSLGTSQTPSDAVSVAPDVASNSLIVASSEENLEVVKGLVELLAKAAKEQLTDKPFEVIILAKTTAADMVRMLDEMYVAEENRRRGDNTVNVSADARLNAVVASGPEADVAAIRRLVAQLDGAKPQTVVEIKYIALQGANVQETVGLIQSILSGGSLAGRNQQQATVLKYLREIDGGGEGAGTEVEMEISAATRQSISLTPDIRTNTVIVKAPRESMALIEKMIKDLDGSTSGSQNIRIFKLANADADAMARILKELFNLRQSGNLYVLKPREDGDAAPAIGADATAALAASSTGTLGADLTLVPDDRQQLSITVDDRTNSLLVSGTPTYLDLVEKVVNELDAQEANTRDTFVYKLKNATATEVARVVNEFVSEDQRKILETLSTEELPSASKLLEREVTVVGDQKSNTVLVNASPKYLEKVRTIIDELDVDPPQVLIQVLLAEVSLDSAESLGPEFGRAQFGDYAVAAGMGNLPGIGGRTGNQLLGSLFSNSGTPNVAIGAEDFELLINALASQSRVQVLSNPSVMVENNSEGFIQVGETVRLPDAVSFSSAGQQSSVTPEDIGILLRVTPSINPEGFVRMVIEPEISRLSLQTTQISENFNSPVITRRKANTTVTVKDGQTVVIGGLISDRFERVDKKIPLLGDIPVLGALFRQFKENSSKTELLIVLTPHVVRSPAQGGGDAASVLSEQGIRKLTLPPELLDQIRKGELQGASINIGGAARDASGQTTDEVVPQDTDASKEPK